MKPLANHSTISLLPQTSLPKSRLSNGSSAETPANSYTSSPSSSTALEEMPARRGWNRRKKIHVRALHRRLEGDTRKTLLRRPGQATERQIRVPSTTSNIADEEEAQKALFAAATPASTNQRRPTYLSYHYLHAGRVDPGLPLSPAAAGAMRGEKESPRPCRRRTRKTFPQIGRAHV